MNATWQNLIVLAVVAACALYLGLRVCRLLVRRTHGGCGGCGNCSSDVGQVLPEQQLISLQAHQKPARHEPVSSECGPLS